MTDIKWHGVAVGMVLEVRLCVAHRSTLALGRSWVCLVVHFKRHPLPGLFTHCVHVSAQQRAQNMCCAHCGIRSQVRDGEDFPADLVCLHCTSEHNVCYVKTTNLDGAAPAPRARPDSIFVAACKGVHAFIHRAGLEICTSHPRLRPQASPT